MLNASPKRGIEVAVELSKRAKTLGLTTAQLAIAWVLHQPGITGTIIGPRTLQHFEELARTGDFKLEENDLTFCDTLVPPGTFVSNHFNTCGWSQ